MKNLKDVRKSFGPYRPFDVEAEVKAILARSYQTDANDFLWRIRFVSKSDQQHRSFMGKVLVDYLMAIECSLKSAVIRLSDSSETAQEAYRVARKASHSSQKLIESSKVRAKRRVRFLPKKSEAFLTNHSLRVSARYELDLLHLHFNTKQGYSSELRDTVTNSKFFEQIHNAAYDAFDFANRCSERSENRAAILTSSQLAEVQKAFKNLDLK